MFDGAKEFGAGARADLADDAATIVVIPYIDQAAFSRSGMMKKSRLGEVGGQQQICVAAWACAAEVTSRIAIKPRIRVAAFAIIPFEFPFTTHVVRAPGSDRQRIIHRMD